MIRNQTDYRKAMCKMIRKIQNSSSAEEINDLEMSIEDAETRLRKASVLNKKYTCFLAIPWNAHE